MLINETPPSIRRIDTSRDDAYAFEVTGHITASDIENMYGLLEGAYLLHEKIDLIVIIHDYEGFDWSAALREKSMLGKTHALKHIRKYAVVGGPSWMGPTMAVLRPFFSMEMRHFDLEQQNEAWDWLQAEPAPPEV
ncbi:STAS/SEC14 domain-containing protein [Nitratireductor thuwali]|uniref:STAS/SEC14 domain-containing protein n=1 Tax=Nitratireductor thuwali TaxID=2267699 RepID=A0ABY5MG13_9HYPH|nr:hypothetical protein NTH_00527 [Nitratireductor thuwali]